MQEANVRLTPLWTTLFGIVISLLFGAFAGEIGKMLIVNVIGFPSDWGFLGFWPGLVIGGGAIFEFGRQPNVKVGHVGVLQIFGQRSRSMTLSEGSHWLVPLIMGYTLVNLQIQTNTPKDLEALSRDRIAMRTSLYYRYRITDPFAWLDADDPIDSLDESSESDLRDQFAEHDADELVRSARRSAISEEIRNSIQPDADEFGMEIIEVNVPRIRYPEGIEIALQRKRIEQAEAEAEKVEIDALVARVEDLKRAGYTALQAAEFLQTERDKATATRHIIRVEDSEQVAQTIANAIAAVFRRGTP